MRKTEEKTATRYLAEGGPWRSSLRLLGDAATEPGQGWRIERFCRMVHLRKRPAGVTARCVVGAGVTRELDVRPNTLQEAQAAIGQTVELIKGDLACRFTNVGICCFLSVLDPGWSEPLGGQDDLLRCKPALQAWAAHFSVSAALLERQWQHLDARRQTYSAGDPAKRLLHPHEFWPPLLAMERAAVPELFQCVGALIVMSWQNASVERDLVVLTHVRDRADGHLGLWRLASGCRAVLEGPALTKERGSRIKGVLRTITK
jgi:hypothetical protein